MASGFAYSSTSDNQWREVRTASTPYSPVASDGHFRKNKSPSFHLRPDVNPFSGCNYLRWLLLHCCPFNVLSDVTAEASAIINNQALKKDEIPWYLALTAPCYKGWSQSMAGREWPRIIHMKSKHSFPLGVWYFGWAVLDRDGQDTKPFSTWLYLQMQSNGSRAFSYQY